MTAAEQKMLEELIEKLAQARNLLCKPASDVYTNMSNARFVDATKKTLDQAREMIQTSIPL